MGPRIRPRNPEPRPAKGSGFSRHPSFALAAWVLVLTSPITSPTAAGLVSATPASMPAQAPFGEFQMGMLYPDAMQALEKLDLTYCHVETPENGDIVTITGKIPFLTAVPAPDELEMDFPNGQLQLAVATWHMGSRGAAEPAEALAAAMNQAGVASVSHSGENAAWKIGTKDYATLHRQASDGDLSLFWFRAGDFAFHELWTRKALRLKEVPGPLIELKNPPSDSGLYPTSVRFGQTVEEVGRHLTEAGILFGYAEESPGLPSPRYEGLLDFVARLFSGRKDSGVSQPTPPSRPARASIGFTVLAARSGNQRPALRFMDYEFADGVLGGASVVTRYPSDAGMKQESADRRQAATAMFGDPEQAKGGPLLSSNTIWHAPGWDIIIQTVGADSGVLLSGHLQNGIYFYPGEEGNDQATLAFTVSRQSMRGTAMAEGSVSSEPARGNR